MSLELPPGSDPEPAAVVPTAARLARCGGARALAQALQASRADTLAIFDCFERALPGLRVPQRPGLNPPLWELGHIGWFQARWTTRNPQWRRGWRADPEAPLRAGQPGVRADADALYDSSAVAHACRWSLSLPDAAATRAELQAQLDSVLALIEGAGADDDDTLYFFRLALLHEDMHHEAALYMAQGLGLPVDDARWQPAPLPEPPPPLRLAAAPWRLGSSGGADRAVGTAGRAGATHASRARREMGVENSGFAFDNELGAHEVATDAFEIDAQALRWAEFLPCVEAGGCAAPAHLRQAGSGPGRRWERWRHGRWDTLDLREAACHLSLDQAQAWCAWAGRRLPTEAEWERAACTHPGGFRWGEVWEWTASPFEPYPGFVPHPYRDYSAPWFDGRPVLRGASYLTQPRMRHPRYRNFFPGHRSDVPAGLRSCAR